MEQQETEFLSTAVVIDPEKEPEKEKKGDEEKPLSTSRLKIPQKYLPKSEELELPEDTNKEKPKRRSKPKKKTPAKKKSMKRDHYTVRGITEKTHTILDRAYNQSKHQTKGEMINEILFVGAERLLFPNRYSEEKRLDKIEKELKRIARAIEQFSVSNCNNGFFGKFFTRNAAKKKLK